LKNWLHHKEHKEDDGMFSWLIFGIVAVLLFHNRMASVVRAIGRSLVEFKNGMDELENEFNSSLYSGPDPMPLSYWEKVSCAAMCFAFIVLLLVTAIRG
jgi:hypothetical protein